MKLWEPPYYDPEKKSPVEGNLNELAVTLMVIFGTILTILMFLLVMTECGYWSLKKMYIQEDLGLPRPHIFQGLIMLQQNALEKLAARDR